MFLSDHGWRCIPVSVKPDLGELISTLLKSKTFVGGCLEVKPVSVRKAPTSVEIIKSIIDKFAGPSANPKDIRVACICSLSLAGIFSYDELSNIAPVHLEFFPDHLRVFVPRAKNDIYREVKCLY